MLKTHVFGSFKAIIPKSTGIPLRTFFANTRHIYEKNEPTLGSSGGGVHGKVCWLTAYIECAMYGHLYTPHIHRETAMCL